ncbi:class I alpha-mannosidase 1A [Talaromyces stipitatus ATCC 10500]|uniref:alpha-1,2-Mannosidase n=1 Tax=Talaromyces stipitatus (strain ATCC 10500 / CBS 375.48 / QM 6759 / NRRL 1006) TaxID=441959 RepID=B8MDC7_TALSN|nr:class I alpha-mannosidase 1A [Talaromyces stipitatus ATCC 10500]EED17652.1 class I alpha-mannosidase 1A [Talaromyces stipitatus ATCC 10500]
MLRSRRYRTFVIFSVIFGLAFLHFIRSREWSNEWREPAANTKVAPAPVAHDLASPHDHDAATEIKFDSKHRIDVPTAPKEKPLDTKKPSNQDPAKQKELLDSQKSKPETIQKPPTRPGTDDSKSIDTPSVKEPTFKSSGDKSYEGTPKKPDYHLNDQLSDIIEPIPTKHWKKLPEHFPIREADLITLPTGQPKKLPTLQVATKDETSAQTILRKQRLAAIKEEFEHAWSGYSEYAMGHDEVRPVSGSFRDPFAGWGATLVDALDTLWIMEMKEEFADAVEQVKKIDFTTSAIRSDIPLFETVIRYLGGLIGAYDISGQKYSVLLDKAVELADILMGAFDTPNRMPVTYYKWAPEYVEQPHRASTRVVLAELGSLSVEFTRLAQLTQEAKYYDAVARITNELEVMQNNTRLPGMWPLAIDASGCKMRTPQLPTLSTLGQNSDLKVNEDRGLGTPTPTPTPKPLQRDFVIPKDLEKREIGLEIDAEPADYEPETKATSTVQLTSFPNKDCEKQGLASPHGARSDRFGLGGQSDSTYEYLPKEYMLLGGLSDQYRSMYEVSMEPVREKLLFRPMLPNQEDIRLVATVQVSDPRHEDEEELNIRYTYEGTHLTCFAGGMFAVGAKLFGIDGDMDIAAKLTEGCVWAYGSTNTGIMPEGFELLACDDPFACTWNETRYLDVMDPNEKSRIQQAEAWYERELQNAKQAQEVSLEKKPNIVAPVRISESEKSDTTGEKSYNGIAKREANNSGVDDYDEHAHLSATKTTVESQENAKSRLDTKVQNNGVPAKPTVLSHKEYVANKLEIDHIPLGYTKIQSRKYILRPEAIESVFIMYRLTGDEGWREKGWKMFQSIARYCRTELADSAISDVTSTAPELLDEMESFWLAETLKYFYLLFSDPSVVSLDEYVLNTEAHPFKRPVS